MSSNSKRTRLQITICEFFTLRVSPPAHPETAARRARRRTRRRRGCIGGLLRASRVSLGNLLGRLGGPLGSSWPSWAILRLSWAVLGASWAVLETSWGHLGISWGPLGGLLGALEGLLGPSWRVSIKRWGVLDVAPPLGGHDPCEGCQKMALPRSEKGPSDTSRHPPSKSRGGGRGRGKPLPEGEEGVVEEGRGIALDHLSPRGLVGFTTRGMQCIFVGW